MSWQATAWAVGQKVGPPARKLLLLVLANYADEHGICWPSQDTLAANTGMSLDTVQRQTKKLQEAGFLTITRPPKRRGQWQTFVYQLSLREQLPRPRNAPRSNPSGFEVSGQAASASNIDHEGTRPQCLSKCGPASPHRGRKPGRTAMRPKPSIEPSLEPSRPQTLPAPVARLQAWQREQSAEVVQNRIAQRLGNDGWLILGEMSEADLERLTELERRGKLDDETLHHASLEHFVLRTRLPHLPP